MPVADPQARALAMQRRLYVKICMKCGAKNSWKATRCRRCGRSDTLRPKNRELGPKKA
ncbi:MAG: 50S ribosomal protein L40e [Nitrososphaeria archaeon]|nr:50S ribosomal protein L40e [Nitrososphaerota archaeon]